MSSIEDRRGDPSGATPSRADAVVLTAPQGQPRGADPPAPETVEIRLPPLADQIAGHLDGLASAGAELAELVRAYEAAVAAGLRPRARRIHQGMRSPAGHTHQGMRSPASRTHVDMIERAAVARDALRDALDEVYKAAAAFRA